tara:strand:+ start:740 stop:874 length:135 start_codon:yes stop_codon:yes gene_type:complete
MGMSAKALLIGYIWILAGNELLRGAWRFDIATMLQRAAPRRKRT